MRKTVMVLAAFGTVVALAGTASVQAQDLLTAATAPALASSRRVVADLWLRQISNEQNLDGDRTTYYVAVYRKEGARGEEHLLIGPRPVGELRLVDNKAVSPNIADRLIRASFKGDTRYVVRITHGDGNASLLGRPAAEFGLDAGNHVVAFVPEAMQCPATPERQPGIDLKDPAHTRLWITVEQPGLSAPQIRTC